MGDVGLATGGGCSGLPMPFPLRVPPSSEHAGESPRVRLGGVVEEGVCAVSACVGADAVVAVVGAVVAMTVASEPGDVGASAVGACAVGASAMGAWESSSAAGAAAAATAGAEVPCRGGGGRGQITIAGK